MWYIIPIAAGIIGLLITNKKIKVMSNCHNLFREFNDKISIPNSKMNRLMESKNKLRERIRKDFRSNHPEYVPKFFIQGSYKMKTMIRTKDDICDLDDGVYFFKKPDVSGTTLQKWIKDAVDGHTSYAPEHRKKCIRNFFEADYEIDIPVYYKIDGKEYQIAIKNEDWRDDDPKAMIDWFKKKKGSGIQLIDLVKYLKAWCDNKRNAMPSGLAMTILAANAKSSIAYVERDDINLFNTLKEINQSLKSNFSCKMPVVPYDDLFGDYDSARKNNFLNALSEFLTDAEKALKEPNQLKASKLWRKHLGDRFPEGDDITEDSGKNNVLIKGIGSYLPYAL